MLKLLINLNQIDVRNFIFIIISYSFTSFLPNNIIAQKLSKAQQAEFEIKCIQLANAFCGYIDELTEEKSLEEDMSTEEFFNSDVCQWNINQMKSFFSTKNLKTNKIIGYTPTGSPPIKYTSIDNYIKLLLNQRLKYKSVVYDFSAFQINKLVERVDKNGEIYYEGKVKFKQNFYASKNHVGNSELGWDVFHEDFKSLVFTIKQVRTAEGRFFAITFHKLIVEQQLI